MLSDAIGPAWDVAVAVQWFELEYERWPTSIDQLSGLDEELGQAIRQPPEPVPIPDASVFEEIRFEVVSDSLLRLHYDLVPFEAANPGEITILEDATTWTYTPPATSVRRSRGIVDVPAYSSEIGSHTGPRVAIAYAKVRTESGRMYEFENEEPFLQPPVFLKPIGDIGNDKP